MVHLLTEISFQVVWIRLLALSLPDPARGLGRRPGRLQLLGVGGSRTSVTGNPGIAGVGACITAAYEADGDQHKTGAQQCLSLLELMLAPCCDDPIAKWHVWPTPIEEDRSVFDGTMIGGSNPRGLVPRAVTFAAARIEREARNSEGQYASALITSPLARVPSAHQVSRLIESLMKWTDPSAKHILTPPG